jgi:Mce-associated membrane protein
MQAAPPPARPVSRLARALGAGAAAVAIAAGVLAALTTRQTSQAAQTDAVRAEALAAGRQIAVDFSSYDYRHLPQDFKRVADEATGSFKKNFVTQSAAAADLIKKAKGVASDAEVVTAGVTNVSRNAATLLLAVNRVFKSGDKPVGVSNSFGLQITLVRSDGRWLARDVKVL